MSRLDPGGNGIRPSTGWNEKSYGGLGGELSANARFLLDSLTGPDYLAALKLAFPDARDGIGAFVTGIEAGKMLAGEANPIGVVAKTFGEHWVEAFLTNRVKDAERIPTLARTLSRDLPVPWVTVTTASAIDALLHTELAPIFQRALRSMPSPLVLEEAVPAAVGTDAEYNAFEEALDARVRAANTIQQGQGLTTGTGVKFEDGPPAYALSLARNALLRLIQGYRQMIRQAALRWCEEWTLRDPGGVGPLRMIELPRDTYIVPYGGESFTPGPSPVPDASFRASGGLVLGAGSGTSDSVPAWLSNGEWVVRAGAVDALGQNVLGMLNQWDQLSPDQRAAVGGALSGSSVVGLREGGLAGASPSASGFWPALRLSGGGPVSALSPFSAMALNPVAWTVLAATVDGALAAGASAAADDARRQAEENAQKAQAAKNAQDRADLATEIGGVEKALLAAEDRLREAQAAFKAYNESVAAGVRIGTDFTTALGAQSKAQGALTDAVKTQTDAEKALAVAKASGTDAQIASATRALAEADQKVAAAKDQTGGFLSFLQKGAESAAAFATQIDNLRAAGASSDVVQKIAQLGAASGGSAAGELLAGGSSSIAQANYLVQLVADLSNKTGLAAAKQYYGPAVDSAQSSVNSIGAQLAALNAAYAAIPKAAAGGIVTAPTIALVGEAGPEAIIPLNRVGALGSGNAVNVSLTVHGSVVQENDLVVSVRDGIAQLMRRRGLDPAIIGV